MNSTGSLFASTPPFLVDPIIDDVAMLVAMETWKSPKNQIEGQKSVFLNLLPTNCANSISDLSKLVLDFSLLYTNGLY